jgi:hypothetical protein
MNANGNMIVDRTRAVSGHLIEPSGSSPFFGWLDSQGGFCTVRVENVMAITPADRSDRMQVILGTGQSVALPVEDGLRLMKRCGWTEGKRIQS